MNKTLLILCCLVIFKFPLFSQSSEFSQIDEFGILQSEDLLTRIEQLRIAFQTTPDSIARVVIHRGISDKMGFPYKYAEGIKGYWQKGLGMQLADITFEFCDLAENRQISLYVLSKRSNKNFCHNRKETDISKSFLFDAYIGHRYCDSCCMIDCFYEQKAAASLKAFSELIRKYSDSKAYLIFHWGKDFLKKRVSRNKYIQKTKAQLIENGVATAQIVTIDGGLNGTDIYTDSQVELWYVAPNSFVPGKK